jgi:hypothetical protein
MAKLRLIFSRPHEMPLWMEFTPVPAKTKKYRLRNNGL